MSSRTFPDCPAFVPVSRLMESMKVGETSICAARGSSGIQATLENLKSVGKMPTTAVFSQVRAILVDPQSSKAYKAFLVTRTA